VPHPQFFVSKTLKKIRYNMAARIKPSILEKRSKAGHWWLMPVILATQEAEIRRITDQRQPGQIVHEILSQKTLHKNRAGGVAQGEGPAFKPQYHTPKKK
jgi:IS30 family transposase